MRKYVQVIKMNMQIAFAYKWNLLLSSLMDIFRIVAEIIFWKVFFDTTANDTVKGYNYNSIITYYIFMFIMTTLMNTNDIGYKIANDIKYPVIAQENGIQGKVYVTFVVGKDGSVSNATIARGVDASLDKEALRVVSTLPKWKPGKQRGKPVNVSYTVPINFQLQ